MSKKKKKTVKGMLVGHNISIGRPATGMKKTIGRNEPAAETESFHTLKKAHEPENIGKTCITHQAADLSNWFYRNDEIHEENAEESGPARAPYNFVPFPSSQQDYMTLTSFSRRNDLDDSLYSGRIDYTIKAETPLFIGGGRRKDNLEGSEFYKNATGQYAIPGSTVRGLIRENVQILSHADPSDDVDDYRLMYRDVAAGAQMKDYRNKLGVSTVALGTDENNQKITRTILRNVKAGYLSAREDGKFIIHPAIDAYRMGDNNADVLTYYVVSERYILKQKNRDRFRILYNRLESLPSPDGEEAFKQTVDICGRVHYKAKYPNHNYLPFYEDVSYSAVGRNVIDIEKPDDPSCNNRGTVLLSGFMNEKKAVYLIPKADPLKKAIQVSSEDVRAFQIDYKRKENGLVPHSGEGPTDAKSVAEYKAFFNLPQKGETKPVFYIEDGGHLYFGFTPYLRMFYDNTIRDGMIESRTEADLAKDMFGSISDQKSYRSKVSFTDAKAEEVYETDEVIHLPLLEPKPSDYLQYLQQDNDTTDPSTYNTVGFRLRGYKQYWLKKKAIRPNDDEMKNYMTVIRPLGPKTRFRGSVYFRNLSETELGLLLWAMHVDDNAYLNIGSGKPYGYGRIRLEITKASRIDPSEAYDLSYFHLQPYKPINVTDEINFYKKKFNEYFGRDPLQDTAIRNFILMKTTIPDIDRTTYMSLKEFSGCKATRSSFKALPTPDEVAKHFEEN